MNFMIFPRKLKAVYIFGLVGILMVIGMPAIAQETVSDENSRLSVKSVIPDSFPEVVLVLKGEHQIQADTSSIRVYEDETQVTNLQFAGDRSNHQLKVAILFDCSESVKNELDNARKGVSAFMKSLSYPGDSLILVNYASDVSNTDLNDNVEVMEMIMGTLEAEKERVLYDALQVGIEALLPHSGRKIIVAMVGGGDEGSETPLQTILQSADILDIPIYIVGVGEVDQEEMEDLAAKTGGDFMYAESSGELEEIYLRISQNLQDVYELTYTSPNTEVKSGDRRTVEIVINQGEVEELTTKTSFRIPVIDQEQSTEDIPVVKKKERNYWGIILAVLVILVLLMGFLWFKRRKDAIGLIVPAITQIVKNPKKPEIKAWVNIPLKDRPARFTIYSASGVPKKDFVFSGSKRKVKIDISNLNDGVYFCVLSNGGLDSARKEMLIET